MGKAIVVSLALVICIGIIAFVVRRSLREASQVGDLNLKQEREIRALLDEAAGVMHKLGPAYEIEESDVLSERSKVSVDKWLRKHSQFLSRDKEINA
jgi:hypothetical protein